MLKYPLLKRLNYGMIEGDSTHHLRRKRKWRLSEDCDRTRSSPKSNARTKKLFATGRAPSWPCDALNFKRRRRVSFTWWSSLSSFGHS